MVDLFYVVTPMGHHKIVIPFLPTDQQYDIIIFLDFSFWVAANMPLDDSLRLQILSINCATERLRKELEIVRKVI